MPEVDLESLFKASLDMFPALEKLTPDIKLRTGSGPGFAEVFFPGDEGGDENKFVVELREKSLSLPPEEQARIVAGELVSHILPEKDPEFKRVVDNFAFSLTGEQLGNMKRMFDRFSERGIISPEQTEKGFKPFFEHVALPAYLRGFLTPDPVNDFAHAFRSENQVHMRDIEAYLSRKR